MPTKPDILHNMIVLYASFLSDIVSQKAIRVAWKIVTKARVVAALIIKFPSIKEREAAL